MGKEIIKLADRVFTAGEQDLQWNGYDKNGNIVSSGVYFCSVQFKNQLKTNKMILVR
jgi:flagellar hook assembly protein FlgD